MYMDEKAKDFVSEIELNFSKSLLVKTTYLLKMTLC